MATAPTRSPADIASNILDFSDAEFAAAPALDVHPREVRLLDAPFEGIAISAQSRIRVDAQTELPIAIAIRCDGERDWDVPLGDNCLLVVTELQTGRVGVVPALVPPKVLTSRAGPQPSRAGPVRPPADELAGHGAQIGWTEVRSRLDVPWRGGTWSFSVVHFDWISNRVDVLLEGGPAAPAAPVAPPVVEPLPAQQVPGLPSYVGGAQTPPAQGVDLKVQLDEQGPATRLLVEAAFALPARPQLLVAGYTLFDGAQERDVVAIVPMTLLLVGANLPRPWRRDLRVPVYGPAVSAGETLQGWLSLDAFAGAASPGPGSFACYLVLDGTVYGPQLLRVTR